MPEQGTYTVEDQLVFGLAALGYPCYEYLARPDSAMDATDLILTAIRMDDLPVRITEGLPWVLANYALQLDWPRLLNESQKTRAQNRLGYLVQLATNLPAAIRDAEASAVLLRMLERLRAIKLTGVEQTLMFDSTGPASRERIREHRPEAAHEWNLLTTVWLEDLAYQ